MRGGATNTSLTQTKMNTYRVKYSLKGTTGQAETKVSASSSGLAREIVTNQNGGKDKVTIISVTSI